VESKKRDCSKGATKLKYFCKCTAGFKGDCCDKEVDLCGKKGMAKNCKNGATCKHGLAGAISDNGYICLCADGYVGFHCEKVDECKQHPCQNGGVCNNNPINFEFECTCPPGYIGKTCEKYEEHCVDFECRNGGNCDKSCTCSGGWRGQYCQDGYEEGADGNWYKVYPHRSRWDGAKDTCRSVGGHLAVPWSKEINMIIHQIYNNQLSIVANHAIVDNLLFWIGINDRKDENTWVDYKGSVLKYTNWAEGEPNDQHFSEDCGSMAKGDGKWHDLNCAVGHMAHMEPFICQKEPGSTFPLRRQEKLVKFGGNVTLPCYHQGNEAVLWEHNEDSILFADFRDMEISEQIIHKFEGDLQLAPSKKYGYRALFINFFDRTMEGEFVCNLAVDVFDGHVTEQLWQPTAIFNLKMTPELPKFEITYKASSSWGFWRGAAKAVEEGSYWCSAAEPEMPLLWWISSQQPLEIVSVEFEEQYPGSEFEFFASESKECAKEGKKLISGNREKINGKDFSNGQSYHCYGLSVTKLVKTSYGELASIKNFHFRIKGNYMCDKDWKSHDGQNCAYYADSDYCKKDGDHYGTGWSKSQRGEFHQWSDQEGRPALVCPQCGCKNPGIPKPKPSGCDKNWESHNGDDCKKYKSKRWCKVNYDRDGNMEPDHYGGGWKKEERGKFERWADKWGRTALVCPQCGCVEATACDSYFRDNRDNICKTYAENQWCKLDGDHYGPKWPKAFGNFENFADDKKRTALVCPECGCGSGKPQTVVGDLSRRVRLRGDPQFHEGMVYYKDGDYYVGVVEFETSPENGLYERWQNASFCCKANLEMDVDVKKCFKESARLHQLAFVICRMLGRGNAGWPDPYNVVNSDDRLDELNCHENDQSIGQCRRRSEEDLNRSKCDDSSKKGMLIHCTATKKGNHVHRQEQENNEANTILEDLWWMISQQNEV